ncbi:hypothetical protein CBG25_16375 [Arsenophonus sp. ENCA]|uniref:hypothetical protein n=1 Tax=Arsenophonus sp. ENCA TaxID=1987579 RepID=UPI000BCE7B84|nr:hypothetical protein [Arsenophonus sp. ENCA]PAV01491.1 hypothetical protein CBG25_16375 [Arsenophonus sp. ENCA]
MIKGKELPTLYDRVGIGSKNYCVTCKKKEDGYDLLLEKKIKIRSKRKVADPNKSTTRKIVFSTNIRISDFDKISYDVLPSSLLYEEKNIFKNIINKIARKIENG